MNTSSVTVIDTDETFNIDNPQGYYTLLQQRQKIDLYETINGAEYQMATHYIKTWETTSGVISTFSCQDILGVMDGTSFRGGVYDVMPAGEIIDEIMTSLGWTDYYVDPEIVEMTLSGIIKPCSHRAALQQVLFAFGVCAATDGGETIRIFSPGGTPESIGAGRTYTGASVDTSAVVTAVRVTAHTYTKSSDGSIEIGGERYRDTETVYTVENPDVTSNTKTNVVEITGATLVSAANGQAVAQRVYNYYAKRDAARAKIVWRGEKLGDAVTLPNPWGGTNTGNIVRMDLTLSNTVAADCEVV